MVAQPVKNPPAMQETQVLPLGWEDPLEKVTATHSSILVWRTPWTKELDWLQFHFFTHSLKGPMTSRVNS